MEHHQTDDDIATLSVTALKALITSAGLSYAGCVEKSDLRTRAREARARLAAAAASEPPENSAVATYRAWRRETEAAKAAYQANRDRAFARSRQYTFTVQAVTTLEVAKRTARRVYGGAHPHTSAIEGALRTARAFLRARETPSRNA